MTDNIHKLETVQKPVLSVDEALINCLEILLAKAKEGEIQGIAYCTVKSNGAGSIICTGFGYNGAGVCDNVQVTLGAIEILRHKFLTNEIRDD